MTVIRNLGNASIILLSLSGASEARLTRIVIETREVLAPATLTGISYEILSGHFDGELDPDDSQNALITDLEFAPRNRHGKVAYSATFKMAKPVDMKLASGVLFYEIPNRGNGEVAADPEGHVRLVSGWQGDILPKRDLQWATVPVAIGHLGSALTAPVFTRFVNMQDGSMTLDILGGLGTPVVRPTPVSLDTARARLFRQTADAPPLEDIAAADWSFSDCSASSFPGTPDQTKICLRGGFDNKFSYGLVYEGKDPKVLGIGFAATRDLNAFIRRRKADDFGTPNPVVGAIRWAVASGTSQSGNFLKSFIHLGFNEDEQHRIVFDGANPNIAARQVPLNMRFGVPGGGASYFEPGSEGALWWTLYDDKVRGRGKSGLLVRCESSGTCPKIVETFGSSELWGLHMSPELAGTDGRADLPLPNQVRRYYFPGVTHGGSRSGGFSLKGDDASLPGAPKCAMTGNPNPSADTLRALQKRLVDWVISNRAPPPSLYPSVAAGALVAPNSKAMGWPTIPGSPTPEGKINIFYDYDFGNLFRYSDESGVASLQPPRVRGVIPQLVPRVDKDGNESSGVASVQLLVPIGTYTGWNELVQGYGRGGGCGFLGGFIPFARTLAERTRSGDPRESLEERYRDHEGFVERVREVAIARVNQGWLLPEDAQKIIAHAAASEVLN